MGRNNMSGGGGGGIKSNTSLDVNGLKKINPTWLLHPMMGDGAPTSKGGIFVRVVGRVNQYCITVIIQQQRLNGIKDVSLSQHTSSFAIIQF